MDWIPHVTVAAIIEENQRFLLVEEESEAGIAVFNQPAGHWDEGETLVHATIRETLEETAYHFQPENVIGVYHHTGANSRTTYLRICFSGKLCGHEPNRALDKGILRAVWMTRDEIAQNERLRSPMVLKCVDDYLDGHSYPLSLITQV